MLYKKNASPSLSDGLFKTPTSEYRGTPFWAWNCNLDREELLWQIEMFKKMGLGGFHMHVRSGLVTPYLSDEFMDLIRACVDKAKDEDMLAWLYDEDRWPSGCAGGIVTREKQHRIKYLLFTSKSYEEESGKVRDGNEVATAVRSGRGNLLGKFDVVLDDNGCLESYRMLKDNEEAQGDIWYAYMESPHESPRYNGNTYVDTLSRPAIERFIEITHEKYKEKMGDEFNKTIPAIFTDEPQFTRKTPLAFSSSKDDAIMPWTTDLEETYRAAYDGEELTSHIPELFWELPDGKVSKVRYHFHDHVCERFTQAFADTIGAWCEKNNLPLTGHLMEEPTLNSQTRATSEVMRSYRSFQLPGIDMLCERFEYTTAKQASSAAHQYGREGVMSELYGVTGWDSDFRRYKNLGDWQAALGVTIRVPHLSWVSMEGEAKRDYPASISYQSPWFEKYNYIEDHFSRLNTALTRGRPTVKVGVIHPIESFWLHFGPEEQTALKREQLDSAFQSVTDWLLFGSVDFDYICESLLPELCEAGGNPLRVGKMDYDVIIVPECETLRSTTVSRLEGFLNAGGKLIFMGEAPKYVDADEVLGMKAKALYDSPAAQRISFSRGALLSALENDRVVELRNSNGSLTNDLLYQLREDGDNKWLFICRGRAVNNVDLSSRNDIIIKIKGNYSVTLYNTLNGEISKNPYKQANGYTVINTSVYAHDSLLYLLTPSDESKYTACTKPEITSKSIAIASKVKYSLSEPNALLLDMAEYSLDGEEFRPAEELLRLDTACRKRLGWTPWGGGAAQPWAITIEPITHIIKLRFSIFSDIDYSGVHLALETPEVAEIELNGEKVANTVVGWYVDKSIKKVALPKINKGKNILEITYPFGKRTAVEWCYILGDFGVEVLGRNAKITERTNELAFDSIVHQTLPFYSGEITYHLDIESNGGDLNLRVPKYRGGLVTASLDGGEAQTIAFEPYSIYFDNVTAGMHRLDLTLYVTRVNTCGPVHLANEKLIWLGPASYRTAGDQWSYEYNLVRQGILTSPILNQITKR